MASIPDTENSVFNQTTTLESIDVEKKGNVTMDVKTLPVLEAFPDGGRRAWLSLLGA